MKQSHLVLRCPEGMPLAYVLRYTPACRQAGLGREKGGSFERAWKGKPHAQLRLSFPFPYTSRRHFEEVRRETSFAIQHTLVIARTTTRNYDQFHEKRDRIYEVWNRVPEGGEISSS